MNVVNTTIRKSLLSLRSRFKENSAKKYTHDEPPLRAELLSRDQMRQHGRVLADSHKLVKKRAPEQLLARLTENEGVLTEICSLLTSAVKANRRIAPAGEWLLDNFYLIKEQIRTAKKHLPKGYSRELPRLLSGPSAGLPRVYDIALETISHGDGRVDEGSLSSFIAAYQQVTALKLGELWVNFKISLFTSQMNNSQNDNLIYFYPDQSTSKIYATFPTETYVIIDASATNSILLSLGFTIDQGTAHDGIIGNFSSISEYELSINKAQLNPIQNYFLSTNISTGNYFDGAQSSIIEAIPIGKTTAGSLTEFDSNNITRSLVTINNIDRLVISLLDNHGELVDLTNGTFENPETFTVEISITEKK